MNRSDARSPSPKQMSEFEEFNPGYIKVRTGLSRLYHHFEGQVANNSMSASSCSNQDRTKGKDTQAPCTSHWRKDGAHDLTLLKLCRARTINALALTLALSLVWLAVPPTANAHGTKAAAGSSLINNVSNAKMIFYDNFDGATLSAAWQDISGTNANSSKDELQCYSAKNVFVRDGSLVERATAGTARWCDCPNGSGTLCSYVSGAVQWQVSVSRMAPSLSERNWQPA